MYLILCKNISNIGNPLLASQPRSHPAECYARHQRRCRFNLCSSGAKSGRRKKLRIVKEIFSFQNYFLAKILYSTETYYKAYTPLWRQYFAISVYEISNSSNKINVNSSNNLRKQLIFKASLNKSNKLFGRNVLNGWEKSILSATSYIFGTTKHRNPVKTTVRL